MWIPTGRSKALSVLMWKNMKLPVQQVIMATYHPWVCPSINVRSAIYNCLLQVFASRTNHNSTLTERSRQILWKAIPPQEKQSCKLDFTIRFLTSSQWIFG
ncbi:hypothetical protein XENTR_v10020663 [Xenopus tropicalis]|nr:hypothetical protein XENTR_v10020663 [Xenopus tropicalis]